MTDASGDLVDVPFYVMEKVPGHVIRDRMPAGYAQTQAEKLALTDALVDVLADLHAVDEPGARLARLRPQSRRASIVHGDYRLDNCLMALAGPARVAAVLDWELSTLGDPLTDLGLLLFYWREPGEDEPALTPVVTGTRASRDGTSWRNATRGGPVRSWTTSPSTKRSRTSSSP